MSRSAAGAGWVMGRRRLIVGGSASAIARMTGMVPADPGKQAAVVIGVDRAGDLPILTAAASGAKAMSAWLGSQGYDVRLFVDDGGPVAASAIFDAVRDVVARGTYTRLLIFFAGHGCLSLKTDFWLLSGAPANPNEAINVDASAWSARLSTLSNVVFVSDCCRSLASDVGLASVSGMNVFPSGSRLAKAKTYVDRFHATQIGDASFEGAVDAKDFKGIYTQCFLNAFEAPPIDFVTAVGSDRVVPDRQLQRYLDAEVPRRALAISLKLRELPDAIITSPDMTYIGRVSGKTSPRSADPAVAAPTVSDLSSAVMKSIAADRKIESDADITPRLQELGRESGFFYTRETVLGLPKEERAEIRAHKHASGPGYGHGFSDGYGQGFGYHEGSGEKTMMRRHRRSIETSRARGPFGGRTGFIVSNAALDHIAVSPGATASIHSSDVAGPVAYVDLHSGHPRRISALIRFGDGTGTVAAVIPGYVGTLVVDGEGVVSLSYEPTVAGGRRTYDSLTRRRLDELKASAAASTRLGALRADRPEDASRLARSIRVHDGIDPTLGLYAAYAFEQAGQLDRVRSIAGVIQADLGIVPFDVAMLGAASAPDTAARGGPATPFCPMLSQGWNYLAATGAIVPEAALAASRHLRQAVWTTFDPVGVRMLLASPLFRGG